MPEFGEETVHIEGIRFPRVKSFSGTNYDGEVPRMEIIRENVIIDSSGNETKEGNYLLNIEMDINNPLHVDLFKAMEKVWQDAELKIKPSPIITSFE